MVNGKPQQGGADGDEASTSAPEAKMKGKPRTSGSLSQLILQAFEASHPRKSLSLAALKKFVSEAGFNIHRNTNRLKRELRQLVSNGLLLRVTGRGASGSFRAKKKSGRGGKQKKKARKRQPAVKRPKGLRGRASAGAPGRRGQLNKRRQAGRGHVKPTTSR